MLDCEQWAKKEKKKKIHDYGHIYITNFHEKIVV